VPGNDLTLSGGLVGFKFGYNGHVADQFVAGVEGDLNWANITGQDTTLFGDPTHTINWLGSIRGRLGYDAGQFLPYLTGGVAFAQATRTTTFGAPNSATATHLGWTAGAGIEFAATEQLSVDLQYRYTDLGSRVYDWSGPGTNPTIHLTANTITAGLNWHF
jgi:opacity protein-like surface antigen